LQSQSAETARSLDSALVERRPLRPWMSLE
jgi:hypothetical protein